MDTSTRYANLIKTILQEHEGFGRQVGNQPIFTHFVYDDAHQEYLMINVGWNTIWNEPIYGVIFHGWVENNKILIAQDMVSPSVTKELGERGVPQRDILSAQEQPFVRDVAATKEPA